MRKVVNVKRFQSYWVRFDRRKRMQRLQYKKETDELLEGIYGRARAVIAGSILGVLALVYQEIRR